MASVADVRDVVRGAIATLSGFGGRIIARLILMMVAGHLYGAVEVGYLGQVAAIVEICAAMAVMGLKRNLMDILSEQDVKGNPIEGVLVATIISSLIMASVLTFILGIIWPYVLPSVGTMPKILYLAIPAIVIADVLGAATRYKRIIKWDVIARCVIEPWTFLFTALIFYWIGLSEKALLISYSLSYVGAAIFCLIGVGRVYSLQKLMKARFPLSALYKIPYRSLPAGITDIGVMAFRRIDILILGYFAGAEATGIYYMVQQLVTVPHKVYQLFEPMMAPVIAKLHHLSKPKKISAKLTSTIRWVFTLQVGITIPFLVFGEHALAVFGDEFRAGALILGIILLAELCDGTFALLETVLIFTFPKRAMGLIILALGLEATAIGFGAKYWGIEGAALGYLLTMSSLACGRLIVTKRSLNISVLSLAFLKPILIALIIATMLSLLEIYGWTASGYVVGLGFFTGLGMYFYLIKTFALNQEDLVMLKRLRRNR